MTIDSLVLELTRRCPLACAHCLRGPSQDKDMSDMTLRTLFGRLYGIGVRHIYGLTLTGGEPALRIDLIKSLPSLLQRHHMSLEHCYMATSAAYSLRHTKELLPALLDLALCCDGDMEELGHMVEISQSDYHDNQDGNSIKMLQLLSFAGMKQRLDDRGIINSGNANINGLGGRPPLPEHLELEDDELVTGHLYITADGDVLAGCDYAYEDMDDHKLGNIYDKDFSLSQLLQECEA